MRKRDQYGPLMVTWPVVRFRKIASPEIEVVGVLLAEGIRAATVDGLDGCGGVRAGAVPKEKEGFFFLIKFSACVGRK